VSAGDDDLLSVGEELDCAAASSKPNNCLALGFCDSSKDSNSRGSSTPTADKWQAEHSTTQYQEFRHASVILGVNVDCPDVSCLQAYPIAFILAPVRDLRFR
jgi:hypothetical protein